MEIQFGEQMTIDEWLGIKKLPRNDSNGWLVDILGENYDGSEVILDSFVKADSVINDPKYKKIMCSISGGADSDCVLHLIHSVDFDNKVDYVFYNTGLEWSPTKDQLKYLEDRYNIKIKIFNAVKPIPISCSTIGQPFISKRVSEMIYRLQLHDFDWSDDTYENHMKRYPNCKIALQWWDNQNKGGEKSNFNILHNKLLREFMIENPPWFKISNRCCDGAKKLTLNKCYKEGGYDLTIYGVRKAENGARAFAYKNCFTEKNYKGHAEYRPIFWYSNDDRKEFEERFKIKHSACYGPEYGLQRTGCAGCSFGRDFEYELEVLRRQDPKLYKGVSNIFKDAYEYTRMYHRYQANNK